MKVRNKQAVCIEKIITEPLEGKRKEIYKRIGTIVEFEGGRTLLELTMFPNLEIVVMPEKTYDSNNVFGNSKRWEA